MTKQSTKVERAEFATVLRRHPRAITEIAESIDQRTSNISNWLADRSSSKRVEKAVRSKVRTLLAREETELAKGLSARQFVEESRKAPSEGV